MSESPRYLVVFEGVGGHKSNAPGVRTMTEIDSREAFGEWYDKQRREAAPNPVDAIVAEGITNEKARDLIRQTPLEAQLQLCISQSTYDEKIDLGLLKHHLTNIGLSLGHDIRFFSDIFKSGKSTREIIQQVRQRLNDGT